MAFTEEETAAHLKINSWKIYWKRADGKWHKYPPQPEAKTLSAALEIIKKDAHACFFR